MNLVATIEKLQGGKPLTSSETANMLAFQKAYSIDDEDPLILVLALMARSQLILESAPNLLQQKVNETMELHRIVMREQAVLISKQLIGDLTAHIELANSGWMKGLILELQEHIELAKGDWRLRVIRYVSFFAGGMSVSIACFWLVSNQNFLKILTIFAI